MKKLLIVAGICICAALLAQQVVPPTTTPYVNLTTGLQINGSYGTPGSVLLSTGAGTSWGVVSPGSIPGLTSDGANGIDVVGNITTTGGTFFGNLTGNVTGHASLDCPIAAGCTFGSAIGAPQFNGNLNGQVLDLKIINVRDYGCVGDGVTDDTACATAAGNAVQAAASGPVTFYWPEGNYVLNPLLGMQPYASPATSNIFFVFSQVNNVTVEGHSATITMKTPSTPYAKQVGIASGNTYQFYWFDFVGGNNNTVKGITFNNNGNAYGATACVQSISSVNYGCFWGNGVLFYGGVTLQASVTQTSLASGVATYTWSSLIGGSAPTSGAQVNILGTTNGSGQLNVLHGTIASITGTTSGTFTVNLNISTSLTLSPQAETGQAIFNQPYGNKAIDNRFIDLEGWPVITFNTAQMLIEQNYAEHSEGMVCANGAIYCTIAHNISVNARDAHYALNGGNTSEQYVSYGIVDGNIGEGNDNGSGIDVTAARHASVTGNNISNNQNWCVLVDRTGGPYSTLQTVLIPSVDVHVSGNKCSNNNQYGGWPVNAEIMVGDQSTTYAGGTFTPGTAASNVHVIGNTILAQNNYGIGVGVAWGSAHVAVDGNQITGCNATACITSLVQRVVLWSNTNQVSDVSVGGNTSDTTYTNYIRLNGTVDNLAVGINPGFQFSLASGAAITTQPQTQMIGEYYLIDNTASSFVNPFQMFAPNSTGTQNVRNFIGHDPSNYNAASFKWYANGGLGSINNWACMGLYGAEFGVCVDGNLNIYRSNDLIIPNWVTTYHGTSAGTRIPLGTNWISTTGGTICDDGNGNLTTNGCTATTASSPTVGQAACIKAAGPPVVIGYCSTVVNSSGACTCN